jgi:hypothetical protein
VTSFRRGGLTEVKVAFWSSVIFGVAHIANLIGGDSKAIAQAIVPSGHKAYPGPVLAGFVYLVCAIVVLVRRQRIEPGSPAVPTRPARAAPWSL